MRKHKFIPIAVCILLVGALTAGLAARAVVTPKAGETVSAGVLSVPSVLGQTAEEVLFYPWPMYDTQTLSPLPEDYWSCELEFGMIGIIDTPLSNHLYAFRVLGASYDQEALLRHLVWNMGDGNTPGTGLLFLKDFPTTLYEDQTPVTLSYAAAGSSVSYLIRPAQPVELTQEQQDAALEKVRTDLLEYLRALGTFDFDLLESLYFPFEEDTKTELGMYGGNINELASLLDGFLIHCWNFWESSQQTEMATEMDQLSYLRNLLRDACRSIENSDLNQASLEELLDVLEEFDCTVQLISTPQQVIILFTLGSNHVFGVYYDIQLEQYSGLGMSF